MPMSRLTQTKTSKHQRRQEKGRHPEAAPQRGPVGPHAGILALQRSAGNRAVSDLVASGEGHGAATGAPIAAQMVLNRDGQPLEPQTRAFMEERFGEDFSQVRVHTDAVAADSAAALGASAYTVGQQVVFGQGRFDPGSQTGRQLLAHELAHTIQQGRGGPPPTLEADSPLEQSADRAATKILQGGGGVRVEGASAPGIARDTPKPPVPRIGHTPFNFISEGPALENWKESVREMLGRNFKKDFATFEDATNHFQKYLSSLPSDEAREHFGDRMKDRARKNFFRREARKPSFDYTEDQLKRLRGGSAPSEVQQLEHMEEVKTKVRGGIPVKGHPERALDPGNIYFTEGGPGGTAPKGTPHAEKWRKIKAAKEMPTKTVSPSTPPSQTSKVEAAAAEAHPGAKPVAKASAVEAGAAEARVSEGRVAAAEAKTARTLGSVAEWGKVGPLDAAMFYLDMHAAHFKALENVSKSVETAEDLLNRVAEFENGARELRKAVTAQKIAESELPIYPLQTKGYLVSEEELAYVNDYYGGAARIANDAMDARSELNKIITGWEVVMDQAQKTKDFTRKSAWEAVTELDLRFSKGGAGFRDFLVKARDDAGRVENWARLKQYHAADILGKWVPAWYTPPTPER
jgi:hypothetical protein